MPGYNAQTYMEEFIAAAGPRELNRSSADNISDTEILRRLNDQIAQLHQLFKPTQVRRMADIVSGSQNVVFPFGRLNQSATQVWVRNENSPPYQRLLTRLDEDQMELLYPIGDTSQDQGEPLFWCFASGVNSSATRNAIRIRPVPTYSLTNGVIFRYPEFPEQLWRIEKPSTKLADFTYNSEYVYIRGTGGGNGSSVARYGDEIGECISTNFDGTSTSDPTVRIWYTILSNSEPNPNSVLTDLVTNGNFTGGATSWTLGGGAAYNANNVTFTGAGTLSQTLTNAYSGNWYRIDFTLSATSSSDLSLTYAGTAVSTFMTQTTGASTTLATNGAKYAYFQAGSSGGAILFTNASGDVTIDTISVTAVTRLTLDRTFLQSGAPSATYIAAQVPDIEYSVPAGVGMMPVWGALAEYFLSQNQPKKATLYAQKATGRAAMFNRDETDNQNGVYNPYLGYETRTLAATITYWADGAPDGYIPYWARGILPGNPTLTN